VGMMSAAGNGYGFIPACDRCVCTVEGRSRGV
jgi:hypothetical protein